MTKSVSEKSIFGEYKAFEDRVTTALLQILHYGGHDLVSSVFEECGLPSNEVNVCPQVREEESRPDGEISCDCHYHIYVESKIRKNMMSNDHEKKQFDANRKLNAPGDGRHLIYITPDDDEPSILAKAPDVIWLSWAKVIERLDNYAYDDKLTNFLIEQFKLLVSHLVYSKSIAINGLGVMLSEDEKASAAERVIIVGGSWGEDIALKYNFYACQEGRYFKPAKYLAFCHKNRIKYLFELVGTPKDSVDLKKENINPEYFKTDDPNYSGCRKLFHLKLIKEFSPEIINDNLDKNGKRCAFVQRQSYSTYKKICEAKNTSEL